jgi:hypothetical protein
MVAYGTLIIWSAATGRWFIVSQHRGYRLLADITFVA